MARRFVKLGAYLRINPEKTREILLAKYREHDGNTIRTSDELGVAISTLNRWVDRLDELGYPMKEDIQRMRDHGKARAKAS